jgi:hypothetical protein
LYHSAVQILKNCTSNCKTWQGSERADY